MRKQIYILDEYITSTKNGIGVFVSQLLHCLKSMDADICHVLFNAQQREMTVGRRNGMKIISVPRFPSGNFFDNWKVVNRIFRLFVPDSEQNIFCFNHSPCPELQMSLRESHPLSRQIYIIHNLWWTLPLSGNDRLLAKIVKNRDKSLENQTYKWILSTVEKEQQMCQIVDAVVCLTEGTLHVLTDIYNIEPKKIFLIPNGLRRSQPTASQQDRAHLRKAYYIDEEETVILFAGRLSETKGTDAVLNAFSLLLTRFSHVRLVLAGSLLPDFSMARYAPIANKITYTGHVERKELNKWYQMADIGVVPSYTEQCSYVGIEMMAYGLPVVVSDGFGLRDMFRDEVNGKVAPTERLKKKAAPFSKNLADALAVLISSKELREKLGQQAKEVYAKHYNLSLMKKRYEALIQQL